MESNHKNSPNKRQGEDTTLIINFIKSKVEQGTGLTFQQIKETHLEEELFYIALKYVATTKKAICTAMGIPVEAGCRYKRKLEKEGLLMQSTYDTVCPITKHNARLISTNPDEFEDLTNTNQLTLF
ncbi:MAG: hypothetical protein KAF41_06590 [Flavobacterium sp.]|nr:hypothetical protein [Flavobacterium sp.]